MTPELLPKDPLCCFPQRDIWRGMPTFTGERKRTETSPARDGQLLPEATFSFSKNKKIYLNSSKQGRLSNRHQRVGRLIAQLASRWKEAGIDLSRIPVSCDSGFADWELVETIRKVGFTKVVMGVKGSYRLYPGRAKKHSIALSQALGRADFSREPGWALRETVGWCAGTSPTFGKVTVLARMMLGKVRRVFAFGVSRACEILRIWKAHPWIEEVFNRLKDLLHCGSYRLRGKTGAYAGIVIPCLAYFVLLMLQHRTGHTFAGICQAIQQWALKDIESLLQTWRVEHFHLSLATTDQILKI